jgi:hypothetical protein
VRSRALMTVLAGIAGTIWSETSRITLRFDVKRRLSLTCWILGHEDWVRRAPGRLYLECLECGRETTGWITSRRLPSDAVNVGGAHASDNCPDRSASDVSPSTIVRSERPADQHEVRIAA